jgi:hypothetical protein
MMRAVPSTCKVSHRNTLRWCNAMNMSRFTALLRLWPLILAILCLAPWRSVHAQVTEQGLARSPKVGLRVANNDGSRHRPDPILPLLERMRPYGKVRTPVAKLLERIKHNQDSVDRLWDTLEQILPYHYMQKNEQSKPLDMSWLKTRIVEIQYAESAYGNVSLRPGSDECHFRIEWSEHEGYNAAGTLAPKRHTAPKR